MNASLQCRTCSSREGVSPSPHRGFRACTTFTSGSVSPRCWVNPSRMIWCSLPFYMGDWACAARTAHHVPLTGQLGRLLAHHQPTPWRHPRPCKPSSHRRSHRWPCRLQLAEVGFDCPDWLTLLDGLRPRQVDLDEMEPGVPTHWQVFPAQAFEIHFRTETLWLRLAPTQQANAFAVESVCWASILGRLLGPAGVAVHLTSVATTAQRARGEVSWAVGDSPLQVLLPRSVARQVPASPPICSFGTWTCPRHDGRRLEVVADGHPLFNGAQLAMTPHWSFAPMARGRRPGQVCVQ